MIPAGQPINEDLEARKVANLQARGEPDLNRTSASSYDIKIDESQRVFVLPASDGLGARAGVIAGALIIASGLTWLVISALPSPFVSASVDRSGAGLNSSAQIPASNKSDRLPNPNAFIREAEFSKQPRDSCGRCSTRTQTAPSQLNTQIIEGR